MIGLLASVGALDGSTLPLRGSGWSLVLMNAYRWSDVLAALAYMTLLGGCVLFVRRNPLGAARLRRFLPLIFVFLIIQAINRLLEATPFEKTPAVWDDLLVLSVKILSNLVLWGFILHLGRVLPKLMANAFLQQAVEERESLKQELAEATAREARARGIIASAMDAIISIDRHQRIMIFNPAAEAMFRCQAGEVLGQPLDRFIPERSRRAHKGYIQEFGDHGAAQRAMRSSATLCGLRADGTEFPIEATISHVWVNGERAYSIVLRDISAHKQMEVELHRRGEELATRDRSNSEWLAMLAHELRNPLAPILNAVAILRVLDDGTRVGSEERSRQKSLIERQVRHLSRLIEDLLDVSRVTRGMIGMEKRPIILGEAVLAAIEATRSQIDAKKQNFNFSPSEEPLIVVADPVRIEQVVVNLLTNASKYTHQGGDIWLNLDAVDESYATVTIRDTGIGIPEEMLGKVFDLFHQEDRSLDRTQGGLGIGLTLVKALVERHGGRVEVYSAGRNQGSEFQVWLPLAAGVTVPEPASRPEAPGRNGDTPPGTPPEPARQSVLIVDDNEDSAQTLAELCGLWGFRPETAYNGWKCLEKVREKSFGTILLDIGLPGMDGYEVCRRLRATRNSAARIVALTGYGAEADRHKAKEAGFAGHLVKPIDPEKLRRLLEGEELLTWEPEKFLG